MSSGYPGWTKPGPYYDPDAPLWMEEETETPRRCLTVLSYFGVAAVAAGIAVALTLILHGSPRPGQTASQPQNSAGTQQQMLMIAGTVTKLSRTAITIGGPNGDVTAAITDATRIDGKIKAGDQVSAQITTTNGHSVATVIHDPAQVP